MNVAKNFLRKLVATILSLEAQLLLKRKKPKIVGITGSVGKTSTKDAIYAILKSKVRVRKSDKSYNSEIGVPLTVLGLPNAWANPLGWIKNIVEGALVAVFAREYPDWLILEMGVDHPGDMQKLTSWIRPDIVVLTRFPDVPVHVEYFETPEAVVAEKLALVGALKEGGVLVYNNDDERIRTVAKNTLQKTLGYSRYSPSDFTTSGDRILYEESAPIGISFRVEHGEESTTLSIKGSVGVQYAYHAGAAIAVASTLDISLKDSAEALEKLESPPGRMRLLQGIKGSTIIDDTYNASPVATEQAVVTLGDIKASRNIAILGDMLELGRYSVKEHENIGCLVAAKADRLATVGVRARAIAQAALDAGMSETHILQYEDSRLAGKELEAFVKKGDVILIKGSQSMRMERTVEELMAEPERAEELLVRQDRIWKSR